MKDLIVTLILLALKVLLISSEDYYVSPCTTLTQTDDGSLAKPYQSLIMALFDQRKTTVQSNGQKFCNNPEVTVCNFYLQNGPHYLFSSLAKCKAEAGSSLSEMSKQPLNSYNYAKDGSSKTITIIGNQGIQTIKYFEFGIQLNAIKVNLKFQNIIFDGSEMIQLLIGCKKKCKNK